MPLIRRDPDSPAQAGPASADALATALARGTPDERWRAARGLAEVAGGADALARALAAETDPRVREAICTSLARVGSPAAVEALVAALRSDDAARRVGALDALRTAPHAVTPRLPSLLADPDPDVRLLAVEMARTEPTAETIRLLCGRLDEEPQPNVCAALVEVLAEIGDAESLPVLTRCRARFPADPFLRFAAEAAARRITARPAEGG